MVDSHALLTRLPLPLRGARLACVKPAASVRSEPGSNSQVENLIIGYFGQNIFRLRKTFRTVVTLKFDENIFYTPTSIRRSKSGNIVLSRNVSAKVPLTVRSLEPSADNAAHVSLSSV